MSNPRARATRRRPAKKYLAVTRRFWRDFPAVLRHREMQATVRRDWGLWLRILFVYRPQSYFHLTDLTVRSAVYRFGYNTRPKESMRRLIALLHASKPRGLG